MTTEEVAKVLARIQLGDNRQADRAVLLDWVETIGDLDFEDAIAAVVMHRRDSTSYLLPAHVRENVRLIRSRRDRSERLALPRVVAKPVVLVGWAAQK